MDDKTFGETITQLAREATKGQLDRAILNLKADRTARATWTLKVGAKVQFDAKTRGVIQGEVKKINRKSVKVLAFAAFGGASWKCAPELLEVID